MGKYILHYGQMAGISYYNSLALRKMGVSSVNVIPEETDIGGTDRARYNRQLPYDRALSTATDGRVRRLVHEAAFCLSVVRDSSLVHYYSARIMRGSLDYRMLKARGTPMIISWAGGDARIVALARKNNPYFYREPDERRDERIRNMLRSVSRFVRYVATDPEMAEYCEPYFEKIFMLPQPIDLADFPSVHPGESSRPPVVLHIPTHREVKGTVHVEAAVARLTSEKVPFEFRSLEPNMTQKQVRQRMAEADIYVDELRCGSYGITAVEAMAAAKPTMTYIREDLAAKYPADLPLVSANPDTIYSRLKELVLDRDLRRRVGEQSRAYVERYHSLAAVGTRLMEIYRGIGLQTEG